MNEAGSIYGLDEAFLLHGLNKAVAALVEPKDAIFTPVVGHNVSGFDLRFLMQRFIVNGIRPHHFLKRAAEAKPWEYEKVFDTMVQFSGVGNRISLDKLCLALSIPSPKGDMDGSMVSQAVADGKILEVVEYCKRDVEATKAVYERMTFAEPRQRQLLAA
jgi:predicted PolB exonuclease-like 3'-5' exonuclease